MKGLLTDQLKALSTESLKDALEVALKDALKDALEFAGNSFGCLAIAILVPDVIRRAISN